MVLEKPSWWASQTKTGYWKLSKACRFLAADNSRRNLNKLLQWNSFSARISRLLEEIKGIEFYRNGNSKQKR